MAFGTGEILLRVVGDGFVTLTVPSVEPKTSAQCVSRAKRFTFVGCSNKFRMVER